MRRLKKLSKRSRTSGLLAGCLAAVALLATASAASAKTYRPTRTDDPVPNGCKAKDCSLREAVIAANASGPAATIVLRPGKRYVLTRKGAGENAALTGDLDLHVLRHRGQDQGTARADWRRSTPTASTESSTAPPPSIGSSCEMGTRG